MKQLLLVLFTIFYFAGYAQQDTSAPKIVVKHSVYERYSTIATLSVGFIDGYRQNYTLPEGYSKSNTSGFAPLYGKLEYGVAKHISIAATVSYDAFVYHFNQFYTGNGGVFTRNKTDDLRVWSGGLTAFYHLNSMIHVKSLDPFIGAGISLSNVRYNAYPQGDTAVIRSTHPVSLSLRAGARYYISQQCSFFGDVGYDKQSIFSLGITCRFFKAHKTVMRDIDSDGDGVPDNIDSCPHVRGLAQFNGCPDSDGDGIPDRRDSCPTVAGPAENNGCPYTAAQQTTVAARLAVIPRDVIQFIPATETVKDSSTAVLDSIIHVLNGNSKMDISIQGYIATGSTQGVSRKMANARAVTIKKYLLEKGIAATRLIFSKPGNAVTAKKHREIIQLRYDLTY